MRALVIVAVVWGLAAVAQDDDGTVSAPQVVQQSAQGPSVREPSAAQLAEVTAPQQQAQQQATPEAEVGFGGSAEEGQPEQPGATSQEQQQQQEEVRALRQQVQELTQALDATTQQLDELQTQVEQNAEQAQVVDESIEPRSVRANVEASEQQRQLRIASYGRALELMAQAQSLIAGGDLEELPGPLSAAAAELQQAAANATLATPKESEHLVTAQRWLSSVYPRMSDRDSQYASIALLTAQTDVAHAYDLARSQGHLTR